MSKRLGLNDGYHYIWIPGDKGGRGRKSGLADDFL